MPDDSEEEESPDALLLGSRMHSIKDRLKDASQKAVQKTSELGTSIAESNVAKDILAGAKQVGEDVKGASAKVSEAVDKKRGEFKERREAQKTAKSDAQEKRRQELVSSIESTELIPLHTGEIPEIDDVDFGSLTVVQLKAKLSELGLKVSGKKDQLIERLTSYSNSDVDKEEENEIDDVSTVEEDVQERVDEVFSDNTSASKSRKSYLSWRARYVNRWLNRSFATTFLILGIACIDPFGSFVENILGGFGELLVAGSSRFYVSYGGLTIIQSQGLRIMVSLGMLSISLMYLFGRNRLAVFVLTNVTIISIALRSFAAIDAGLWVDVLDYGPMILDLLFLVPLLVSSVVPWFAQHEMISFSEDYMMVQNADGGLAGSDSLHEEGLISDDEDGDTMDQFAVTRPTPPRRRRPMELFYEGVFLLVSMILWPLTIGTHFLLALEIPTRYGTWTMEANALTLLVPLYALSMLSALVVVRSDREARGGPLYAKEKEAYQKFMDQFLSLKEAYYERQAKRLSTTDDSE